MFLRSSTVLGFSGEGLCLEDSGFQRNGGLNEGDDTVYTWAVLGDKQIMGVRLVSLFWKKVEVSLGAHAATGVFFLFLVPFVKEKTQSHISASSSTFREMVTAMVGEVVSSAKWSFARGL